MNSSSDSESSEPPGPSPWTIEFHLDDLVPAREPDTCDESAVITCLDQQRQAQTWDVGQRQQVADLGIDLDRLTLAIQRTLEAHDLESAEVSAALVTGPRMRVLNQQYLQHDFDTDVLSFCLSDPDSPHLLAQLIVSVDYAAQQASQLSQRQPVSLNDELCLYLVHGTLHTLGYDDHSDQDRMEMREAEREILATMGLVPFWPSDDVNPLDSGASQ